MQKNVKKRLLFIVCENRERKKIERQRDREAETKTERDVRTNKKKIFVEWTRKKETTKSQTLYSYGQTKKV